MKKIFILVSFFALLVCQASDVAITQLDFDSTPAAKKRYLAQPYSWWGRGQYPVKNDEFGKIITLTNSRTRYVFFFFGKKNVKGEWFPVIGMVKPSKANWGASGFFNFKSGKLTSQRCSARVTDVENGGFTITYTAPDYTAQCRMELKKDDDRLYVLFNSPQETAVQLTAYPSSYAGSHKKGLHLRKRYGLTPSRRLPMGKSRVALDAKEYYILLADSYFDPASNRGEGPCGVIYDPKFSKCSVGVLNYGCNVTLTGKGPMPFVLFDFKGTSNAEAERIMKELPVRFH